MSNIKKRIVKQFYFSILRHDTKFWPYRSTVCEVENVWYISPPYFMAPTCVRGEFSRVPIFFLNNISANLGLFLTMISLTNNGKTLVQWFLTLLEVPNPTSSIHAIIGPFVVGKIKCVSWILFFYLSCSKSLAAEPLKLTRRIPGVRSNPG